MDDAEIFRQMDEKERMYAPEQLPASEQERVRADEGIDETWSGVVATPAPNVNPGYAPPLAPASATTEERGDGPVDPGEPRVETHHPLVQDAQDQHRDRTR